MNQEASQAINSLEKSIAQFLLAPLSGQAYDSAKRYFNVVYTPICRSVTMTGEAMANAHKRLISEYQSSVASIDIDEDQIMSQINRFEQLKQNLEHQMLVSKDVQPSLERRYINACECIAKKREQLEKFHDYNARSASFFSEYEACEQELARGIAQVSGCKAWNAASGTFDIGKLDMTWATSINDRWGKRAEELENKRAKNFAEGMKGRQYCRVQLATGAYVWMWVTDPTKVSQADFQFNQKYKDYLAILMKPENNLVDDYFKIMAEELRTGINQKTGKPLTDLEKAQRWSAVASAIAVLAVAAHYGAKGFTGKGAKPSKNPVLKGSKDGKNYTLDRNKSKGSTGYKKASGAKDIIKNNLGKEIDITPSKAHTKVNKNPGPFGEPNSSVDILDSKGELTTRRFYDDTGKAVRDVDMTNHGNPKQHPEYPHEHKWKYDPNGKPTRE
ncbi:T7SS effector LXG polymorphic toxin [Enterococcus sp. DIV0849a]